MAKILVGTNVLQSVDSAIYGNHINLFFHLGRSTKHEIMHMAPRRMNIDNMRNSAAKIALENDCDYILFIDDDVLVPNNLVESLIDADKDIVMAHTYIRGYPFKPMSFVSVNDDPQNIQLKYFEEVEGQKGVVPCKAVGFSAVLIKTQLFKELEPPFFITGPFHTEDVYFCIRCAKEIEREVTIAVDTRVPTGHMMEAYPVGELNVKEMREFFEKVLGVDPPKAKDSRGSDRANDYLKTLEQL